MTGSYQLIAAARPRVKRDVLYTQTAQGVLFHNAEAGFQLAAKSAYRLACVLVPRLTGEYTIAQLCDGLGAGQQEMVAELVTALLDRGFARDVEPAPADADRAGPEVAARFAPQINYIDHYTGQAEERFQRFRTARVAVLGTDQTARWCALSLVRNGAAAVGVQLPEGSPDDVFEELTGEIAGLAEAGCPVDLIPVPVAEAGADLDWSDLRGFDVVLVTAGARQVTGLLRSGIPAGVSVLPASVFGGHALVGPLMTAGRGGCWVCAALRFGANRPAGPAADVWSELVVPPGTGSAPSRALAAMLGNLLAYEVFRLVTGALPAETDGRVIIQDLDSMGSSTETLLAHPRCPFCPGAATAAEALDAVEPRSPETATVADADQADEMFDELLRRSLLVQPSMGVFTAFDDDEITQLPLKASRIRLGLGHAGRRTIAAFDVHHVVGARLSAVYRAAEAYAEHLGPLAAGARAQDAGLPRIQPADLAIASGTGAGAGADAGPDSTGTAGWVRATSLLSTAKFLVPAAAVAGFGAANRDGRCLATSAGSGAGRSAAEALGRGLATALAQDALRGALARERAVTRIDLSSLDPDPELVFLVSAAGHLGLDLELLDLGGSDASLHVLVTRATDETTGRPVWAIGSDVSWQRAARDAMCDLIGQVQLGREHPGEPVDTGDPLMRALDPYTLPIKADAVADPGAVSSWSAVLDDLRARGRDVLAVPTGSVDLERAGITAVRVLLVGRD